MLCFERCLFGSVNLTYKRVINSEYVIRQPKTNLRQWRPRPNEKWAEEDKVVLPETGIPDGAALRHIRAGGTQTNPAAGA